MIWRRSGLLASYYTSSCSRWRVERDEFGSFYYLDSNKGQGWYLKASNDESALIEAEQKIFASLS